MNLNTSLARISSTTDVGKYSVLLCNPRVQRGGRHFDSEGGVDTNQGLHIFETALKRIKSCLEEAG